MQISVKIIRSLKLVKNLAFFSFFFIVVIMHRNLLFSVHTSDVQFFYVVKSANSLFNYALIMCYLGKRKFKITVLKKYIYNFIFVFTLAREIADYFQTDAIFLFFLN